MLHNSLWLQTAYTDRGVSPLAQNIECDVCVVGGGFSGIANAYFLAKAGVDVVLLEKDGLLGGPPVIPQASSRCSTIWCMQT